MDEEDRSRTLSIQNRRGQTLFCRYWEPQGIAPKALVFLSHGFSEHLGTYHNIANALLNENCLVFGHDHVGHGRSDGKRAYIESINEYVDDLVDHCLKMQRNYSDLPLYLVGHSMGGMIVLSAALYHPELFKGIVLQGPLIIPGPSVLWGKVDFRVTPLRAFVARSFLVAMSWYNPNFILGDVNLDRVTRDDDMKEFLAKDDLRWPGGCKVRLLLSFLNCLNYNTDMLMSLKTPFLTLHGTNDELCNIEGSRILHKWAAVEDKKIVEYPDAMHNLYVELPEVRESAIQETVDWIMERVE